MRFSCVHLQSILYLALTKVKHLSSRQWCKPRRRYWSCRWEMRDARTWQLQGGTSSWVELSLALCSSRIHVQYRVVWLAFLKPSQCQFASCLELCFMPWSFLSDAMNTMHGRIYYICSLLGSTSNATFRYNGKGGFPPDGASLTLAPAGVMFLIRLKDSISCFFRSCRRRNLYIRWQNKRLCTT